MWTCLAQGLPSDVNSSRPPTHDPWMPPSAYCLTAVPLALTLNLLVLGVNLGQRASMMLPDVYFTNMSLASFVLAIVSTWRLLGGSWAWSGQPCLALYVLFNVSSLVFVYSAVLLGLDYFVELSLASVQLSSAYQPRHVCEFLWGGSALASLSSLLSYACIKLAPSPLECASLQTGELGDAILFFVGFLVPLVAAVYSLVLIGRLHKEEEPSPFLCPRPQPQLLRLLAGTAPLTLLLWLPYHCSLLLDLLQSLQGGGGRPREAEPETWAAFKVASEVLGYASGWAVPVLYLTLRPQFWDRFWRTKAHIARHLPPLRGTAPV
ncbi:probable G-protein coupled receptor 146 [Lepisosteus oculatus]|uniref:probable G-protein coupled receptor 146 n=1 Tax=Lepisosteus oculatus TaxID=7918 RepID=UPI0035F52DF6